MTLLIIKYVHYSNVRLILIYINAADSLLLRIVALQSNTERGVVLFDNLPDVLTLSQCQEALQIGRCSMLDLVKNGELKAVKIKGRWRITKHELEMYLKRQ